MLKYARRSLDLNPGFACFEHSNLFKVNGLELCADDALARVCLPGPQATREAPACEDLLDAAGKSFLSRARDDGVAPTTSEAREAWKTRAQ